MAAGSRSEKESWNQNSAESIEAEQQNVDDSEWRRIEKDILSEDQEVLKPKKLQFQQTKGPDGDENDYEDIQIELVDDVKHSKRQLADKNEKMDHSTTVQLIQDCGYPENFILNSLEQ